MAHKSHTQQNIGAVARQVAELLQHVGRLQLETMALRRLVLQRGHMHTDHQGGVFSRARMTVTPLTAEDFAAAMRTVMAEWQAASNPPKPEAPEVA